MDENSQEYGRKLLGVGSTVAALVVDPIDGPVTRTCPRSCSLTGRLRGSRVRVFSNAQEFCRITKFPSGSCSVHTFLKRGGTRTDSVFLTGCIETSCL